MKIFVQAAGLLAPGLEGWSNGIAVLAGRRPFVPTELPKIDLDFLPRNERRRATPSIRMALAVAKEATANRDDLQDICSVFACSGGDPETLDKVCTALTLANKPVSPMHFTNSVHNAPAGHWSIATRSQQASTSLSAYDATFAAGLLEAATMIQVEHVDVLLVVYDVPPPPALWPFRPLAAPFAMALLLSAGEEPASLAGFSLSMATGLNEHTMQSEHLEAVRLGNPAARGLPLLSAMARLHNSEIVLPYLPGSQLVADLECCAGAQGAAA
ncbi:MAG: beta-ketoacyl synthase chain length factor [Gammaproteobacteria bacterium]